MNFTTITQLELNNALRLSLFFPLLFLVHSNNRRGVKTNQQLSRSLLSAFWCMCALFSFSAVGFCPLCVSVSAPLFLCVCVLGWVDRPSGDWIHAALLRLSPLLLSYHFPSPILTRFFFPTCESVFLSFQSRPVKSSPVGPSRLSLSSSH